MRHPPNQSAHRWKRPRPDRWRIVGTYRVTSATITSGTVDTYDKPKEQFVYHHAGADGRGGSSYIDSVILRDRDANNAWTAAGDTTLEERLFYAQNWRADVSLILNTNGRPLEKVKYSAYGVALPWTDLDYNSDGILSPDDSDDFITTPYDYDLDGDTDATDSTNFVADYGTYTTTKGVRGEVSLTTIGNRKGYAGYEFDGATKQYHVRHRVYVPELGRWTRRDPLGYVDGVSLLSYTTENPIGILDPSGLVFCDNTVFTIGFAESKNQNIPPWFFVQGSFEGEVRFTNSECSDEQCKWSLYRLEAYVRFRGCIGIGGVLPSEAAFGVSASGWIGGRICGEADGTFVGEGMNWNSCTEQRTPVRVCGGMTLTARGEIGGELTVRYRSWRAWTVGIVGYVTASIPLQFCVTCDRGHCWLDTLRFGGVQFTMGYRVCMGFWCIEGRREGHFLPPPIELLGLFRTNTPLSNMP